MGGKCSIHILGPISKGSFSEFQDPTLSKIPSLSGSLGILFLSHHLNGQGEAHSPGSGLGTPNHFVIRSAWCAPPSPPTTLSPRSSIHAGARPLPQCQTHESNQSNLDLPETPHIFLLPRTNSLPSLQASSSSSWSWEITPPSLTSWDILSCPGLTPELQVMPSPLCPV